MGFGDIGAATARLPSPTRTSPRSTPVPDVEEQRCLPRLDEPAAGCAIDQAPTVTIGGRLPGEPISTARVVLPRDSRPLLHV